MEKQIKWKNTGIFQNTEPIGVYIQVYTSSDEKPNLQVHLSDEYIKSTELSEEEYEIITRVFARLV